MNLIDLGSLSLCQIYQISKVTLKNAKKFEIKVWLNTDGIGVH